MGIENISAARVSEFNRELDAQGRSLSLAVPGGRIRGHLDRRSLPEGPGRRTSRFRGRDDRLRGEAVRKSRNPGCGADV